MAADYCTVAELKTRLSVPDSTDDNVLASVVTATSRAIDRYTDKRFYVVAAEARYFGTDSSQAVFIGDATAVTAVATDTAQDRSYSTVWSASDFELAPYNAPLDGQPYTEIRCTPSTTKFFLTFDPRAIKVTGSFGYSATTPDLIHEATLIQAARIFKRKEAPFGVAGFDQLGVVRLTRLDPDVAMMLESYKHVASA